ncbi:hypothetical protein [Amycolatopsis albispora]|uniref:Uncharacterized protein n=1 Tax=Amycolatopsis albispora TaxID=1804986 RepID=A0A344LEB3_9PSEU|nr:hypothetical protein [Amycolatopsis albispora]AXB46387.1 hypothetical protein A4R43_31260 [Amycolatopsis albispora]
MTEELIRDALAKQADRAPHGDPIRYALAAERPSSRRGLVVGVVAALVVTLALVATSLLAPSTTAPVAGFAQRELAGLPMRYDAGWLPDGYAETSRTSSYGHLQTRTWTSGPATISLMVQVGGRNPVWTGDLADAPPADRVSVHGSPGAFERTDDPDRVLLSWLPKPDVRLGLLFTAVPGARSFAQRVAESVHESEDVLTPQFDLGLAPERVEVTVGGSSPATATTTVSDSGIGGNWKELDAVIAPAPSDLPGGYEVPVRGLRGTFVPFQPETGAALSVPLGDGRWLVLRTPPAQYGVQGPAWESALVEVAEKIVLNSAVDFSWVGAR